MVLLLVNFTGIEVTASLFCQLSEFMVMHSPGPMVLILVPLHVSQLHHFSVNNMIHFIINITSVYIELSHNLQVEVKVLNSVFLKNSKKSVF